MGISTPSNASTVDCIRQIHGSAVANELINFEVSDDKWGFKASGWTTNANYHVKKTTILLFINHRSVESSAIKKAIDQTYSAFLPKGGHPFIYLSLDIDPARVDVNVHPTKREVNFLNEDEIIESICTEINARLSQVDTSRTFTTQSLLPGAMVPVSSTTASQSDRSRSASSKTPQRPPPSTPVKPWEYQLVRTDPQARKITSMLPPSTNNSFTPSAQTTTYLTSPKTPTTCCLTTVKHLRAQVRDAMHSTLTETIASHTYVGLIDPTRRIAAIQGGVKLFLVDYGMLSNEYFYQLGLTDFGNFGAIRFSPPLDIASLIAIAVDNEKSLANPADQEDIPWSSIPEVVTRQLIDRRAMLAEYFNFNISPEGELESIPLLMKNYTPSLAKLPRFLMRLGPYVNWVNEQECFHTFLTELASFYTPEQLPPATPKPVENNTQANNADITMADADAPSSAAAGPANDEDESSSRSTLEPRKEELARVLEHVLFPAFKAKLVATRGLLKGVIEVADLKGLYRVFERC